MGALIVSISGIRDRTIDEVDAFRAELAFRNVPASLLVAPRLKGGYRLDQDPRTVEWLIRQRSTGDAVVLHGYDEAATKKLRSEFATLQAHEANLRLMGADRVLEHLGLRTRLFAAPGWTVSQGTVTVLPRNGFRLLVGLSGITDLVRDSDGTGPGARHRRGFPDRAVVVPHPGAVGRAHRATGGHRARRGVGGAVAPAGSAPGPARRDRPGVDARVFARRLPVGSSARIDRRRLTGDG